METAPSMRDCALLLSGRGFNVIPLHPPFQTATPNIPSSEWGKHTLVDLALYQERHSTREEIEAWWAEQPQANIGVITGCSTGLVVLNVNGMEGEGALSQLPPLPPTIWSETANGRHYWYTYPSEGKVGMVVLGPGLSLIGDGGYVVAPPSLHQSRKYYTWGSSEGVPFAPLPDCFVRAAMKPDSFPPSKKKVWEGTNFNPIRADELMNNPPSPIEWIWDNYLPTGTLVVVSSAPKVGKSTLTYSLAVAIAQGRAFLEFPTKRTGVLILAVEEHPRDIHARLLHFGMNAEDPIHVHAWKLDCSPVTIAALKEYIERENIGFVLLDTLSQYWDIMDENNNDQVKNACSPFSILARETNAVVVLVHHQRKSDGNGVQQIRGASALSGSVDQILMLDKRQGGAKTQRILRGFGRYPDTPDELIIELDGTEYRNLGSSNDLSLAAKCEKVRNVLTDKGKTVEELTSATGLAKKAVDKALTEMEQMEEVVKTGKGVRGAPFRYQQP
jgi:hypothetical protein